MRIAPLGGEMISLPAVEEVLPPHLNDEETEGPSIAIEATPSEESPEIVAFSTVDVERTGANEIIRNSGMSALHNVRQVIRVEEIPILGTGKTNYRALKEQL
jgi:long-chain-fatty-acid--[acyl-carrier-protein] ligase|tara:strand:+ start:93 stop:398 length:306 start_codon:yes stop_codon:yes gene_type:complete